MFLFVLLGPLFCFSLDPSWSADIFLALGLAGTPEFLSTLVVLLLFFFCFLTLFALTMIMTVTEFYDDDYYDLSECLALFDLT